jgi:hypothetical protein
MFQGPEQATIPLMSLQKKQWGQVLNLDICGEGKGDRLLLG